MRKAISAPDPTCNLGPALQARNCLKSSEDNEEDSSTRLKYKTKESFSQARRWLKSSQQVNGSKYWHNINETKSAKMLSTQKVWFLFRIVWFSHQWDSRVSRFFSFSLLVLDLEPFQFHFHFSKKSEGVLFFTFHFSKKSESYPYFTLFSREKRVKSGAGYNLTSIFVPNCISKYCQISSKHQPQNIGQISVLKSWPNPVLHVWTKLQLKKSDKKYSLDILTTLQLL